tara:strand:- start:158 stop:439 length:282 start_codon:yes stop_codon:yes gene_type:complete
MHVVFAMVQERFMHAAARKFRMAIAIAKEMSSMPAEYAMVLERHTHADAQMFQSMIVIAMETKKMHWGSAEVSALQIQMVMASAMTLTPVLDN